MNEKDDQDALLVLSFLDTDPLRRFFERLKLGPKSVFFWVLVFNLLTNVVPAILLDAWGYIDSIDSPGLSKEPGAWVIFGIAQPFIMAYFVWIVPAGDQMIKSLFKQGRVIKNQETIGILQQGVTRLNSPWLKATAITSSVLIQTFVVLLQIGVIGGEPNSTWIRISPIIFSLRSAVAIVAYYALVYIILYAIVFFHTHNKIMRTDQITVEAYHHDNAGGFGVVGQFVTNSGYLVFAIGISIGALYFQADIAPSQYDSSWWIAVILAFAAYLLIAPTLLYFFLKSTHRAMVRNRDGLLSGLSIDIDNAYHNIYKKLTSNVPANEAESLELQQLEQLYQMTSNFPCWPINTGMTRKYYSLVAAPIVSFFVAIFLMWVNNQYFPTS